MLLDAVPRVRLVNLFGWRRLRVVQGLQLLRDAAPDLYDHLFEHVREIRFSPTACGPALACTWPRHRAVAYLGNGPHFSDVVEMAVTLSHESRHFESDELGRCWFVPHEFEPPSPAWVVARDPIYAEDAELREHLRWFVGRLTRRRWPA